MPRIARIGFAFLFLALGAAPAAAQLDHAPKVQARLIAERDTVAPGGTVSVALEQDIREGWHTYWVNPGDAGAATDIQWTLPAGWSAGKIQWPYPIREPVGPLMDYGYEGKPWLLIDLTAPKTAKPGDIATLSAVVNWLVCKEVCVPEEATLAVSLRIDAAPGPADPTEAAAFAQARAKLPVPAPWKVRFQTQGDVLDLLVGAPSLLAARPVDAAFFPSMPGAVKDSALQRLGWTKEGPVLRAAPGNKLSSAKTLQGVLVLTSTDGSKQAVTVDAARGVVPEPTFGDQLGLAFALTLAFLGGLILNLMPCVLPVLAMKALALASHAGADRREAAREGLAYGAGAILSFLSFGVAIILLRLGGAAVGWGFQLQEPLAVAGFALLIFAVGLNLSGLFELPGFSGGDKLSRMSGSAGAFFTGVLAVAVAAPCTAPFMAAALGYALTQSTPAALAVFLALGVGFAAPFIAFGFSPALRKLLPKPGIWMVRLRQILAVPMYATAAWLVWVLAHQTGMHGVTATMGAMAALAAALWIWTRSRTWSARGRGIGGLATLLGLVAALSLLATLRANVPGDVHALGSLAGPSSQAYTRERLETLRAQHRAVFVNATAAWCITCLVNEEAVLSRASVREAFATNHVAYLVADWTNRDPQITALLEAHGRDGVPLYLYYAPGADAVVLPQILTESEVLKIVAAN
jgi:thiol:disulfide interchange protein DsbD